MVNRVFSFLLGVLAALAGVVALAYALNGIAGLRFFKGAWLGEVLGVLVPGVLSASAFYMAVRLFKSGRAFRGPNKP
ncbi:MAG TPA: hypothetical protein VJK29_02710 [Terriglobales bacterium]|nr:hypothetical protein [Terriglobales bacterium]